MILFLHVLLCGFFFFFYFIFFYFCQNHLIITSDVIICTGYTISANTLVCECTYSEIIGKGTCCMFIGVKNQHSK